MAKASFQAKAFIVNSPIIISLENLFVFDNAIVNR